MRILKKNTTSVITILILSFFITEPLLPSFVSEKIKNLHHPTRKDSISAQKKDWTLLVYMMADKNISTQAVNNIKQMTRVGSTNFINVVVQLDKENEPNIERFYILKNEVLLLEEIPQTIDNVGGTSQSLYNFMEWGIKTFPSDKLALVLWNYGTGIKEPSFMNKFLLLHRNSYFIANPQIGMLDLNSQLIDNLNLIKKIEKNQKKKTTPGSTNELPSTQSEASNEFNFKITNQDLKEILEKAKIELLNNKKIDLVCIDSCFMAMFEVASLIKNSTHILVASQDLIPPMGYNYETILNPFLEKTLHLDAFATHIVNSFKKEYSTGYTICTQSAINLEFTDQIEQYIKTITSSMLEIITLEPNYIIGVLKYLRNNQKCTIEFYDSDYIDLFHFFKSLINAVNALKKPKRDFSPSVDYVKNLETIKETAQKILDSMQQFVIKNVTGKKRSGSCGVSIYFPQKKIQESYKKTTFDIETNWSMFLESYLMAAKQIQEIQIEEPKTNIVVKTVENKKQQTTRSINITTQQPKPQQPAKQQQKQNTPSIKQQAAKEKPSNQQPVRPQAVKQQSQKNSTTKQTLKQQTSKKETPKQKSTKQQASSKPNKQQIIKNK